MCISIILQSGVSIKSHCLLGTLEENRYQEIEKSSDIPNPEPPIGINIIYCCLIKNM